MKTEEPTKDGDVSPINNSVSNLPEETRPPASKKKVEPTSEIRPNFTRVTPAQLSYISFPPDGRYQPVRPVTTQGQHPKTKSTSGAPALGSGSERYAGGGGIIILTDSQPGEDAEYIEIETAAPLAAAAPQQPPPSTSIPVQPTGRHIALDEGPEAEPPESFEVCCS